MLVNRGRLKRAIARLVEKTIEDFDLLLPHCAQDPQKWDVTPEFVSTIHEWANELAEYILDLALQYTAARADLETVTVADVTNEDVFHVWDSLKMNC